jgi:hypothetical protein
LDSAALNGGCGDPKSTSSQKNLPRVHWYPFSHHTAAQVIHDMFLITNRVLMFNKYPNNICGGRILRGIWGPLLHIRAGRLLPKRLEKTSNSRSWP